MKEEEIKKKLTEDEYYILREQGTEAPFSGVYDHVFEDGTYHCKVCDTPLFNSEYKYDSGCGWPAFDRAINGNVNFINDYSHNMVRLEAQCAICHSHLGHVFEDGPAMLLNGEQGSGQRFCINSASLDLKK